MTFWNTYPPDYRQFEVKQILAAVQAGTCLSVLGLSGAGKSNLLGFIAQRIGPIQPEIGFVLVDCNRLHGSVPDSLFVLIRRMVEGVMVSRSGKESVQLVRGDDFLGELEATIKDALIFRPKICLLFDRFDIVAEGLPPPVFGNLRALRDAFKYQLSFVTAARRPLDPGTELAELFFGRQLWLGPLSPSDARWSLVRDAARFGLTLTPEIEDRLLEITWGYPALLRAAVEAWAGGSELSEATLLVHPAIRRRVDEFWADAPDEESIRLSGLAGHPLLIRPASSGSPAFDTTRLTAKENLLLAYLSDRPGQVCEKDDLIRAVWPEDQVFLIGVRDDSLAQLIRRLRAKIEPDPSTPRYIQTIPGRGYRFVPA